jgi:hypothetical protein
MKILAIAKVDPETTLEKMQPYLEAEAKHAWKLYKEGTFREVYARQDRLGVVFVLECSSVDEARTILDELPFVREKLIDFELIPLGPFFHFEMLFRDHQPPPQE